MSLEPSVSQLVLNYDLAGAQVPTQKFVLTLLGHHDYPPEPWEYFNKILGATRDGGALGYICGTKIIEAPASAVMTHLSRKGEKLPNNLWILKNQQNLYMISEEFCMRGVIPILDGLEPISRAINNRFLARSIYLSEMKS